MGQLVFQATLGGQVNLVGPNTASTFNINVPAVAGNMVTTGDTGTVTNTMLAGSIANAKLTNSSVTVGSTSIALGATSTTLAGLTSVGSNLLTSAAATALTLQSASTTAVTIDTSQNVGIGTTNPDFGSYGAGERILGISNPTSGTRARLSFQNLSTGTSGISGTIAFFNSSTLLGNIDVGADGATNKGYYAFYTNNGTSNSERMRIDSSGNVGIGTTSPSGKLNVSDGTSCQVNINSAAAGATRQILFSTSTNTQEAQISANNSTGELKFESGRSGTSAYFQTFYTNNSERMRIDSSGNLLVGTTSNNPAGRANSSKFVVSQTAGDTSTFVQNSNSYVNMVSWVNTTSATRYHISFGDGSTYGERGVISTNGTGTTYGTNSDYRLKENIAPMTGALSVVAKLKPVTYKWKSDGSDGQGFIAHELQAVVPECVVGEKDAVDENGNPKYQGIDTSFLVATLTAAIQELKAINDQQAETLTQQTEAINALTARVVALEAK